MTKPMQMQVAIGWHASPCSNLASSAGEQSAYGETWLPAYTCPEQLVCKHQQPAHHTSKSKHRKQKHHQVLRLVLRQQGTKQPTLCMQTPSSQHGSKRVRRSSLFIHSANRCWIACTVSVTRCESWAHHNSHSNSTTATTNNKSGTVSVYSMTLPVDAEPLVEFGTSHRIVWIKLLSSSSTTNQNSTTASTSTLSTIGKGIIGSRDEQTTRTILTDWTEGQIILVPSTEGTASGWIHTKQQQQEHHPETPPKSKRLKGSTVTNTVGGRDTSPTDSSSSSATTTTGTGRSGGSAYAVMYVAKIPKGLIESTTPTEKTNHNTQNNSFPLESDSSSWASTLIEYCRKGLLLSTRPLSHQQEEQEHDHSATSNTPSPTTATTTTKSKEYYIFSKEDAAKIKLVFCQAEEAQSRQERYR